MKTLSPGRPARALAAAMCLLLASSTLLADWEESYKKGKEAYDQGKMGEAIREFREAIKDKNEEKASAIRRHREQRAAS